MSLSESEKLVYAAAFVASMHKEPSGADVLADAAHAVLTLRAWVRYAVTTPTDAADRVLGNEVLRLFLEFTGADPLAKPPV